MKRVLIGCLLVAISWAPTVVAQPPTPSTSSMIYVEPTDDGFETYIVAAILKKKVPTSVVQKPELATLTLKASKVEEHKDTTGTKVVKCLFASNCGNTDQANTSVQLIDKKDVVVWSYSVNKARGEKNRQSMAEAIASHLKSEYFHK